MNLDEFNSLLDDFENDDLEFRAALGMNEDKDRDIKTIVAFYNTRGGKIIFGVQEDGHERKVVGLGEMLPQTLESNLVNKIRGRCNPEPNPFPKIEFFKDGSYLSGGVTISGQNTRESVFSVIEGIDIALTQDLAGATITGVTWGA